MRTIITLALVALALIPSRAAAQTSLTADRIYLGATGCALRTGSGTPTGGAACDFYLDIPTGHVWVNHAGTWVDVSTRTPVFTSISTPLVSTASGDLTLRPAADLVLDPLGRDVVPASNYFTNLGLPSKKFLALNAAELDVETLVAQGVISTIGGRVLVAPTTTLVADLTPAATTITVKHNQIVSGDVLFLEGNGQVEFLAVTSNAGGSAGAYTYSVTRNLDGSGADAWTAGDAVANFGTTGDGVIDINSGPALGNGGPSIIGYRRNSATFNDSSPRFVVGDLNNFYGHNTETYGFAAGNPSGAYIYADETNGLVLGGPSGVRAQITPAGAATFIGDGGGVTNINGGNIQTDTITAAQIAANAITTSELAANAVTAAKIQAGTITGDKIAAGTITAGALLVGPSGTALNDDPNVRDASAWQITNASIVDEGLFGPTGPYSWRNVGGAQGSAGGTRQIAIDAGRTYRIHGWGSGSGTANGARMRRIRSGGRSTPVPLARAQRIRSRRGRGGAMSSRT
jgi:hypothetical protein